MEWRDRLFQVSLELLCVAGTDGFFKALNPAWERALGFTEQELLARPFYEFIHPEDHEPTWEEVRRLAEGRDTVNFEIRLLCKDGSYRWLSWTCPAPEPGSNLLYAAARDVTEQKRATEALRQSEARFRSVVEEQTDFIVRWRPDGVRTFVNEAYARYFGEPKEELIGTSFFPLISEEHREMILRKIQSITPSNPSAIDEHLSYRADRALRWQVWVDHGIFDPHGNLVELQSVGRDIHEHKEAQQRLIATEKALRESQAILEKAQAVGSVGSWVSDPDHAGRLHWSEEACRIFGLKPGEFDGRVETFFKFVHPDDLAAVQEMSRAALAGEREYDTEHRIVRLDGSIRWVHEQADIERDAAGHPLRMVGVVQDITERRQAEQALRESEAKFRGLVENARDIIFTLSGDGAIVSLNPAFETTTKWSRDEWLGRAFPPIVYAPDLPAAMEYYRRAMSGERPAPFEIRIVTRTGGHVMLEFTVAPHTQGGRVVGVLGIARDVTERKQLEEQLRQSQKMDSIGQLAAGVAHDFNNLLTVQQGYISMVLAEPDLPEALAGPLKHISDAAERAANLTQQLLLFSRKQVMQPRPLNLNQVTHNLTQLLGRILGEDVTLEFSYDDDAPMVVGDAGMMEQVIMNLAVNARDAMPGGGRLAIGTHKMTVTPENSARNPEARPGLFACLTVSDTGTGIAAEHLPHIFEPFFTTKGVGKGTGLGLATVYGIVKQHQGWIEVTSVVGRGTSFRIFIPARVEEADTSPVSRTPTGMPGGKETILLVEDEEGVRRMVELVLRRLGYNVLTAVSGPDALRVWADYPDKIDLLLTDMVMPEGMSGRVLAEELLAQCPALKVIYTSGYSAEVAGQDLTRRKGFVFLQKPYPPQRLAQLVRQCLDQK
ncbi:MAG: PAS domain S-box protein [Verrucomicrobiota bacterium]